MALELVIETTNLHTVVCPGQLNLIGAGTPVVEILKMAPLSQVNCLADITNQES